MEPLITIIVPVYNIAQYLPRFFESMEEQTFKDYKMVVLNDGSTDDSLNICKKYAKDDERIMVVELKHLGITEVRNRATEYITTPFTVCADGDDYVEPYYLEHLLEAQKKYNSDLVISRVTYHRDSDLAVMTTHPERGEMFITKNDFIQKLPMLLDDRRLNYVYGKLYRSEFFQNIHIDSDVKQGSDTMINCQYISKIKNIVLIDDLDYHYIKYKKRSVTSYKGQDMYERICRINGVIYDDMKSFGYLTDKMVSVIDGRVLLSAQWILDTLISMKINQKEKEKQITQILNHPLYLAAYRRQKNNVEQYNFNIIKPMPGKSYLRALRRKKHINQIKASILSVTPKCIVDIYHIFKIPDDE